VIAIRLAAQTAIDAPATFVWYAIVQTPVCGKP